MPTLGSRAVLLPDGQLCPGTIEFDGGLIGSFTPARSGAGLPDTVVAPGFIDIQVNGHEDVDVSMAQGSDWARMDSLLLAQGVTAWCPTLITSPPDVYPPTLARLVEAAARPVCGAPGGAPAVLGAHLEGPFLGGLPGAHDRRWVRPPDTDWLAGLPAVRIVTLAPELPGALEAVRVLVDRGVLVALGHSTADYALSLAAADCGARLVTHLFNAVPPLHHREPGLAGAALADPRLTPSVIADLVHVHPAVLGAAFRARHPLGAASGGQGDPGVVLITDAVAWRAGHLAGTRLRRADGDAPRRPDGTIAGSALTMDLAVRNAISAGLAMTNALAAASRVPARLLGLADRGMVAAGRRGDLVVLDPELGVRTTWVGGVPAWQR